MNPAFQDTETFQSLVPGCDVGFEQHFSAFFVSFALLKGKGVSSSLWQSFSEAKV